MAGYIVTRTELARLIRVTPDRVTRLIAEGMPVKRTGGGRGRPTRIDLAKALPWLLERRTSAAADAKARRDLAQALEAEQRVAIKARELVSAKDVEHRLADEYSRCRTKLLALPHRVKAQRPGLTTTDIGVIDDVVREALEELAGA